MRKKVSRRPKKVRLSGTGAVLSGGEALAEQNKVLSGLDGERQSKVEKQVG